MLLTVIGYTDYLRITFCSDFGLVDSCGVGGNQPITN